MMVDEQKNVRIVVPAEIKQQWELLLQEKRISQQAAVQSLIIFLLGQDDMAQSAILGQVKMNNDVLELILRRVARGSEQDQKVRLAKRLGLGEDDRARAAAKDMGPRRMKPQ